MRVRSRPTGGGEAARGTGCVVIRAPHSPPARTFRLHRTTARRQEAAAGALADGRCRPRHRSCRRRDLHLEVVGTRATAAGRASEPWQDVSGLRLREQPTCEFPSFPQDSTLHDWKRDVCDKVSVCTQDNSHTDFFRWRSGGAQGPPQRQHSPRSGCCHVGPQACARPNSRAVGIFEVFAQREGVVKGWPEGGQRVVGNVRATLCLAGGVAQILPRCHQAPFASQAVCSAGRSVRGRPFSAANRPVSLRGAMFNPSADSLCVGRSSANNVILAPIGPDEACQTIECVAARLRFRWRVAGLSWATR